MGTKPSLRTDLRPDLFRGLKADMLFELQITSDMGIITLFRLDLDPAACPPWNIGNYVACEDLDSPWFALRLAHDFMTELLNSILLALSSSVQVVYAYATTTNRRALTEVDAHLRDYEAVQRGESCRLDERDNQPLPADTVMLYFRAVDLSRMEGAPTPS